jgi:hypothetical protein
LCKQSLTDGLKWTFKRIQQPGLAVYNIWTNSTDGRAAFPNTAPHQAEAVSQRLLMNHTSESNVSKKQGLIGTLEQPTWAWVLESVGDNYRFVHVNLFRLTSALTFAMFRISALGRDNVRLERMLYWTLGSDPDELKVRSIAFISYSFFNACFGFM